MDSPLAAYQGDEPYIFVSYAHQDSDVVYPEIQWLHDQGFNIWFDEGISPGSRWSDELATSLKSSALFLYFCTPSSIDSSHCQDEINLALDEGKPVIAVRLMATELTPGLQLRLSSHQAILKYDLSDQEYKSKLLAGVAKHFDQTPAAAMARIEPGSLSKRTVIRLSLLSLAILAAGLIFYFQENLSTSLPTDIASDKASDQTDVEAIDLAVLGSIAVLPFTNMSADEETGVIAKGLADDILDHLAQSRGPGRMASVQELKVASRTASFQMAERGDELTAIAEALNVAYVLEGSVRKRGDVLRIIAQLIRAEDSFHVWSRTYDREFNAGFEMLSAVALSISHLAANELRFDLFSRHASEMDEYEGVDPEALQFFITARDQYRLMTTAQGGDGAVYMQMLKSAVDADPDFAVAHLQLAHGYFNRYGESLSLGEASAAAHAAIDRVMQLDPDVSWILGQLAQIQFHLDFDYSSAEATFKEYLVSAPTWVWSHHTLARIAVREGRISEARRYMSAASSLDAFERSSFLGAHGWLWQILGDYRRSVAAIEEALSLTLDGSGRARLLLYQSNALRLLNRMDEANTAALEAWDLIGNVSPESFVYHFAAIGDRARAEEILGRTQFATADKYLLARGYLGLGDIDSAFKAIEASIENHDPYMFDSLRMAEWWEPLRDDPRFDSMIVLLESKEIHTEQYLRDHSTNPSNR
jgi:TolB-like protein|tara:strand:+ start:37896 stop:40001 length:2106 start_codon:yes stop_codon:yes gene_type:complete